MVSPTNSNRNSGLNLPGFQGTTFPVLKKGEPLTNTHLVESRMNSPNDNRDNNRNDRDGLARATKKFI